MCDTLIKHFKIVFFVSSELLCYLEFKFKVCLFSILAAYPGVRLPWIASKNISQSIFTGFFSKQKTTITL